jgi:hypothetical protein
LRTAMYDTAKWDLISYNFGLHDLGGTEGYESALTNFTARLLQTGAKLAFVSTTPFMPDYYHGNTIVEQLNTIAQGVAAAAGVPYLDLYHWITAYCGGAEGERASQQPFNLLIAYLRSMWCCSQLHCMRPL